MRKSPWRAVSLVLLSLGPVAAQEARQGYSEALREVATRVNPAVVALEGTGGRGMFFGQTRGTGFFISSDGHIVTDAAVVGDRRRVSLRLINGLRGRARVIGRDPLNRIALLELEEKEQLTGRLPGGRISWLPFGDSRTLRTGETVFTVGNAFDSLAVDGVPAFSRGVVSRVGRLRDGQYKGVVIETDAAINHGSYGGPLLDREGRVVGVVSEEFSARRFLGAAIPGEQVRRGAELLKAGKAPARGMLGVTVKARGGEATGEGLEVTKVLPGSCAAEAGVQAGDRLLEIDGLKLRDEGDLAGELDGLAPGSTLVVRLRRGQTDSRVVMCLSEGEAAAIAQAPPTPTPPPARRPDDTPRTTPTPQPTRAGRATIGLQVSEREGGQAGLVVSAVDPQGPADLAGIKSGDLLLSFEKKELRTLEDLRASLASRQGGDVVELRIERDGWKQDLKLKLGTAAGTAAPTPTPEATSPPGSGWLGVAMRPASTQAGALIEEVEAGSPAEAAGLLAGDVVVRADGNPIASRDDLVKILRQKRAGEPLKLHVLGKTERDVTVTLGARPGSTPAPRATPAPEAGRPWLGVELDQRQGKLVVTAVDPKGPVAKLGIKEGDAFVSLEGKKLETLDGLGALLAGKKVGDRLKLVIERGGWEKEFALELSKKPD